MCNCVRKQQNLTIFATKQRSESKQNKSDEWREKKRVLQQTREVWQKLWGDAGKLYRLKKQHKQAWECRFKIRPLPFFALYAVLRKETAVSLGEISNQLSNIILKVQGSVFPLKFPFPELLSGVSCCCFIASSAWLIFAQALHCVCMETSALTHLQSQ